MQHACRDLGIYPDLSLTFTLGTTLSHAGMIIAINHGRRLIQEHIAEGEGDLPAVSRPHQEYPIVDHRTGLIIVVRPVRKLIGQEEFTFNQLDAALYLLLQCVLQRGYRDEIWAYVFWQEKVVGYIILRRSLIPGYLGNMTSDVSAS